MRTPFSVIPTGLRLCVRLTPRASRNGVDGLIAGADGNLMLQLRLAAPPVEGAANKALVAYLADTLGLRKSAIRIVSGEKSRIKLMELDGEGTALLAQVEAWLQP
jgi:uncharacterized protein (TIGR00251 family)